MDDSWIRYAEEFTSPEGEVLQDLVFDRVRPGGFIIADNVLWSGKVLHRDKDQDDHTKALHAFNWMVKADSRVSNVLLPIRDGLMVVRKERG
jgi:caffeoyl-CoA O-methyltransferase